jgi:hypothetical protein
MDKIGIGKTQTKFQKNILIKGKYTIKAAFLIGDNSIVYSIIFVLSRFYTRYIIIYLVLEREYYIFASNSSLC